ncbi:RND superfamily putative drug exporter [Streptomyces umbrinus]|uniref:RND superfamily putative drug exporter n=1 Tax=Streptomyces umbrinus TaxID=67370 RepID=A0ABU0TAQ3_9ACTN|nr:MMPL family transporter [Streptomyces umbrinus]MDQ1032886.1 RND superfamily putative drug exporter [Streptomyces umbrinus]
MATFLYQLGQRAFRRRRWVALLWVAVLAVVGIGALSAAEAPDDSSSMPGIESQKAFDLINEQFPGSEANGASARIVFVAPGGQKITAAGHRSAVDRFLTEAADGPQVADVSSPFEGPGLSKDKTTAYATVTYKTKDDEVTDVSKKELEGAIEDVRDTGLTVEVGGSALATEAPAGMGEIVGVLVAAVVLLITFGSFAAAGLPLITAVIGVSISLAGITALANAFGLPSTSGELAMMLGLAVGIDYSLFVVSRYREERAKGRAPEEAVGLALGTAGSAVVFAGLTVVIALAGLSVVGVPMLTKMGLSAAGTVVVGVLIALTLVPALLGFWPNAVLARQSRGGQTRGGRAGKSERGPRIPRIRIRRRGRQLRRSEEPGESQALRKNREPRKREEAGSWSVRWASFVLRRPVAVLLVTVAGLGALAVPALDLRLGMPGDEAKPTSTTERRAYDALAEGFGPGFNGPLTIVVDARDADDPKAAVETVAERIGATKGVVSVSPAQFNEAEDTAVLSATPSTAPTSERTKNLVHTIRDERSATETETGATFEVTGTTALNIDIAKKMQDALIPYLVVVVGLAFLLLLVVFRSVLVPLKAALGFLLSVLASFGAVVTVFQNGHGASLLGVDQTGPIMSLMPIFLVGIVFGLAMDYQVFLVSRMREAYVHGEGAGQAVVSGFRHSGRIVVAAALIMMAVFSGFMTAGDSMVKMVGFGLATAVLFDAIVVRMVLVPAVLALLGKRAWWLPGWLDRLLPRVDIEGEALNRRAVEPPAPTGESHHDMARV